ncbi:amidohydrolase family protein [Pontibacter sp. SD6]|uniref:Amidohydrolase family protein n=1 Tax=Pontibacter cellulosilyticus TaxID=1720253 RepID=A0A923N861_9BACT|nr:amidohydrolase family protein [Pontibacter cellulosilyticus]
MALSGLMSCTNNVYDLVITDANVLDVRSGETRLQHVFVKDGKIAAFSPASKRVTTKDATKIIKADGQLLTPGLVDVHFHTSEILGKKLSADADSIALYRHKFSESYLPYGVTTVRSGGDSEQYIPMLQKWQEQSPAHPDFLAVGAALVSTPQDPRPVYAGHVVVNNPEEANAKIDQYHKLGFTNTKLYWRLREPEFAAAISRAKELGIQPFGHVDYKVLPLDKAIALGLKNIEHAYTIGVAAIDSSKYEYINSWAFVDHYPKAIKNNVVDGSFFISRMELFNQLGPDQPRMMELIQLLKENQVSVTPTIHLFAQRFGLTYFTTPAKLPAYDYTEYLTAEERNRCRQGYAIMGQYIKLMHEAGVQLNLGTDWDDPGKAALSEMLELNDIGIPMVDVFKIATLNGAKAIGRADTIGTVEVGKRANLVLFSANPLDKSENLLKAKTVIKDGVVYRD